MIILVVITLLPLFLGFIYSILNTIGIAGITRNGFTMQYWVEVFDSGELVSSLIYSCYISCMIIIISCTASLAITLTFRSKILRGPSSYLFYIPLSLPFIVAAFISFQLLSKSGLFSRILYSMNFIHDSGAFPDLINDPNSFGIIFTHVIIATAFFSILFSTVFKNEKLHELGEAARTLGASKWALLKKVWIPGLLQKTFPSILLYGIFMMGSYEIPLLLGTQQHQMISVLIAQKFQKYNLQDIPIAYIFSAIYTVMVTGILFFLFKKNKLIHEIQ